MNREGCISYINAQSRTGRFEVFLVVAVAVLLILGCVARGGAAAVNPPFETSDTLLVRLLPGFENGYAQVNGVRLHYVIGGKGPPLFLLPGWPETWWAFHKVMPVLAGRYRVVAVDLRGMGGSSMPRNGYDKKSMAKDIYELARHLGYHKVYAAGHDIGSMVAFSYAANYPEATLRIALMNTPHPEESLAKLRLLPEGGQFGNKADENHPFYPWWFALNQVRGLPEQLLDGRFHLLQQWVFNYLLKDPDSISPGDRAIYAAAYDTTDAVRASNGWYRSFGQDIVDYDSYQKVKAPILAVGSIGYDWLRNTLPRKTTDLKLVRLENCGYFLAEEQPELVAGLLSSFFQ